MGSESPAFTTHTQYTPGDLVIATHDLYTDPSAVIVSGATLVRGDLVGIITSGGKYKKSLTASSDGSEVPVGVMLADIDAAAGDVSAPGVVALAGAFDTAKINFGASHTVSSVYRALAARGVYLYTPPTI